MGEGVALGGSVSVEKGVLVIASGLGGVAVGEGVTFCESVGVVGSGLGGVGKVGTVVGVVGVVVGCRGWSTRWERGLGVGRRARGKLW